MTYYEERRKKIESFLIETHGKLSRAEQAEKLGLYVDTVGIYLTRLYRAGVLTKEKRAIRRPVTDADREAIVDLAKKGYDTRTISKQLKRSINGVRSILRDMSVDVRYERYKAKLHSSNEVAQMFGVHRSTVMGWYESGLIDGFRYGDEPKPRKANNRDKNGKRLGDRRAIYFRWRDIVEFAVQRRSRIVFSANQIVDEKLAAIVKPLHDSDQGEWWQMRRILIHYGLTHHRLNRTFPNWPGPGWVVEVYGKVPHIWVPKGDTPPPPPMIPYTGRTKKYTANCELCGIQFTSYLKARFCSDLHRHQARNKAKSAAARRAREAAKHTDPGAVPPPAAGSD